MSDVIALEGQLADAKELVARKDRVIRLSNNNDFKSIIMDEFCVRECARYAQSSADPALGENERADALAMAQAAGHLRRFLSVVIQMGRQAEGQMHSIEEALVEARAEEDAE